MNSPSSLKAHLFDLADQDRTALATIREQMELDSNALAVRIAIRNLARQLNNPARLSEPEDKNPEQRGDQ
jgi:hypothetical protein